MQRGTENKLTIPAALVIVAIAIVASTLIFVFAKNPATQEQTANPETNSEIVVGAAHENDSNVNRQMRPGANRQMRPGVNRQMRPGADRQVRPGADRKMRPHRGEGRGFIQREKSWSKTKSLRKGKSDMGAEKKGNMKPKMRGKGKQRNNGDKS